ncbi:uncharacterized protein PHALS_15425 [Plasmopara halstedii]|uniref:Uncharacterized protein n=1 Tax=Plasmopara halstedii TaxID=4781 RepID=A0A0P1AGU1_PLAHL|nr:uncharacterized protein PHALS_15425 [Plasmopara halstedii]CEG40114.1 hypothetical protein PHALS_15425 [Plasmopara halstedii]|eukprot:XP_024576483.1 hypothetical protein PHALS_15425 [Plasmopara halstedii]
MTKSNRSIIYEDGANAEMTTTPWLHTVKSCIYVNYTIADQSCTEKNGNFNVYVNNMIHAYVKLS